MSRLAYVDNLNPVLMASRKKASAAAATNRPIEAVKTESRHKRYRKHRAEREQNTEVMVNVLKDKVLRGAMYVALLAQGKLLRPNRFISYRRAVLSYFSDTFDAGVDSLDPIRTEKQLTTLRYHLREDCVVEGIGIVLPDFIMNVWEIYTLLYDRLNVRFVSMQALDPDHDTIALLHQVSMIITNRSIHFLMPHMLQNTQFMAKVVGKVLTFRIQYHVRFDEHNQIVYVNIEHQMAQAWLNILRQPTLVNLVLKHMQRVDGVFIQRNYQQLINDREFN